jgi:hypothetical protein
MSHPNNQVEFCPTRTNIWSQVQYADFSNVQVTRFSDVQYFQPSDSEEDDEVDEEGKRCPSYQQPRVSH